MFVYTFRSEPLLGDQYLEHCTTLAKKEQIELSRRIHGDLFDPSYELVGLLAHSRAPPAVLFTLSSASDLAIPRIADYPPNSEPGELGAKLLLPISSTIQPRLLNHDTAAAGDLRMFFCGLTLPGRFFARAKLPLRAIVVFAHKDNAHELIEIGAMEIDPFDNSILCLDKRSNSWNVATRVMIKNVYKSAVSDSTSATSTPSSDEPQEMVERRSTPEASASRRLKVHVGVVDSLDFRDCGHLWADVAQKFVVSFVARQYSADSDWWVHTFQFFLLYEIKDNILGVLPERSSR